MRLPARILLMLISLCPPIAAAQASLNKCIDAQGATTYTNKPCGTARETLKVEIDPPPVPDRPRAQPIQMQPQAPEPAMAKPLPASTIQLETKRVPARAAQHNSAKECDALTGKLGRVLDKMDQARRKGYSQKQMDSWNEETRELERKKQQSGCF